MKKLIKGILCTVLTVSLVMAFTGCAKISYIANGTISAIGAVNDGSWKDTNEPTADASGAVVINVEPFTPGTYGGITFDTKEDVVNYYVECYNNTKAQTALYADADGNTQEYYALLCEEKLSVDNILVDGTANSMLNSVVPGIVETAFTGGTYGLPPSNNRNPLLDNENVDAENPGNYDFRQSYFTAEYCEECSVAENSDGTITLSIQPKNASMSSRGADSQGSFFEVLGDLGATVDGLFRDYSMLSWASGSTEENCFVNYDNGTGKITIDPQTGLVIAADYHMGVYVEVNHANVTAIKDKSGAIYISHDIHYPASDEYLLKSKGITRL